MTREKPTLKFNFSDSEDDGDGGGNSSNSSINDNITNRRVILGGNGSGRLKPILK